MRLNCNMFSNFSGDEDELTFDPDDVIYNIEMVSDCKTELIACFNFILLQLHRKLMEFIYTLLKALVLVFCGQT